MLWFLYIFTKHMGLFNFFRKKQESKVQNNKQDAQKEFINDITDDAEKIVESFGATLDNALDYSIESLFVLDEQLLSQFHENSHDVDEQMKNDIITQAGSYIFEVARRNFGGIYYWYDSLNQPILVTGQPKFEISLLAFEKVKLRIENGKEDNIPFFFKGYADKVLNARDGEQATYV